MAKTTDTDHMANEHLAIESDPRWQAAERATQSSMLSRAPQLKAILLFIVRQAILHPDNPIHESEIARDVLGRRSDFNSDVDNIVRVQMRHLRKKLDLYFSSEGKDEKVKIEIPLGAYKPVFSTQSQSPAAPGIPAEAGASAAADLPAVPPMPASASVALKSSRRLPRWAFAVLLAICALLLPLGIFLWHRTQAKADPLMQVWSPLLTMPDSVVISVGRPFPEHPDPAPSPNLNISQHIWRSEFSLQAVSAISQMAGFLQTQKKPFRVGASDVNTLADFHKRPTILVNANDNQWTLLVTKPLRFHFASGNYIQDSEHPENRDWHVDFNQPYMNQTEDYAIVARFHSPSTGGPVMVIAGISSNGSEAAGEFIVSPDALAALARQAHASLDKDFEAVLRVQVVGGNTGAATVIAYQFW
jgi:hypothetical protein